MSEINKTELTVAAEDQAFSGAVKAPKGVKGVNLRQGPGAHFPVLKILNGGAAVIGLKLPKDVNVPGWALVVEPDGMIGWMDTRYVKVEG